MGVAEIDHHWAVKPRGPKQRRLASGNLGVTTNACPVKRYSQMLQVVRVWRCPPVRNGTGDTVSASSLELY